MWLYIIGGILFFLLTWLKIVQPNTARIVVRLWKPVRVIFQWLRITIPFLERTLSVPLFMKNVKMDVNGITEDNVSVKIQINVITKVKDDENSIMDSEFVIDNPYETIMALVEEQLRASVFNYNHKEIFWKREELWKEVKELLEKKMGEFWMKLDSVQVVSIELEEKVTKAMNRIVEAIKNKEATITEAEGEKQRKILEAEWDKAIKKLHWEWMAEQRKAITHWFKQSIEDLQSVDSWLNAEKILSYILDINKQEVLENIWKGEKTKLIYLNENLETNSSERRNAALVAGSINALSKYDVSDFEEKLDQLPLEDKKKIMDQVQNYVNKKVQK